MVHYMESELNQAFICLCKRVCVCERERTIWDSRGVTSIEATEAVASVKIIRHNIFTWPPGTLTCLGISVGHT